MDDFEGCYLDKIPLPDFSDSCMLTQDFNELIEKVKTHNDLVETYNSRVDAISSQMAHARRDFDFVMIAYGQIFNTVPAQLREKYKTQIKEAMNGN